jgi:hypothetical protein
MAAVSKIDPATAALDRFGHSKDGSTYAALSELTGVPGSTLWHRRHGRASMQQKGADQQYLTPQEEKALVAYILRMARNGFPLPVKFLRDLAAVIVRQRTSIFQVPADDGADIRPPGKNWPQALYKRHQELKAMRLKALDWERHDHNIYDKVVDWFSVIEKELAAPQILPENIYNMDETGVLLSVLNSLKVLVGKDELRDYRGVGVKRTLITAIECISADGRHLHPLIIWPAATHRSTWTVHPTPGWHFGHSETGYTNTAISWYWIQHVFDPQTKDRAKDRPRILISDGFGTHESLEIMQYCYENNIILCRLPSHTSHKLQPCDVGVFGPLKTAYREQVERLYRGGSNMIGKPHFTLLYDRARTKAFTARNVLSGWSKSGLRPLNPDKVLKDIPKPDQPAAPVTLDAEAEPDNITQLEQLETPTTSEGLLALRKKINGTLARGGELDRSSILQIQRLANAAENAFADRAILLDENLLLFEQNNERNTRKSTKATAVGSAKVMSYEDIVEAQKQRDMKEANTGAVPGRGRGRPKRKPLTQVLGKRSRSNELEVAEQEIRSLGLEEYCSVLRF